MTETVIEPNGDVSTPWSTGTPHWSKLNDGVTQPTAGDGTYIRADENDDLEVEEFDMEDVDIGSDTVSQVVIWIYARSSSKSYDFDVDIYWSGAWEGYQTVDVTVNNTWAWFSVTFTVSGGDADVDAMKVRIRSDSDIGKSGYTDVDAMYAVVTHAASTVVPCKCIYGGIGEGIL
jgi:hypothetical protein